MTTDDQTQATESTDDSQAATRPPHSRRGFLRKTATTGILGMTGLAVATETASASEADENNRTRHDKDIEIYSMNGGWASYDLWTTGDIDHIRPHTEPHDRNRDPPGNDRVSGRVHANGMDKYAFNGDIEYLWGPGLAINIDYGSSR